VRTFAEEEPEPAFEDILGKNRIRVEPPDAAAAANTKEKNYT